MHRNTRCSRGILRSHHNFLLGKELEALPGLHTQDVLKSGLSARVDLTDSNETMEFEVYLHLDGSSSSSFFTIGENNYVKMKSPWISPSFDGAFLPLDKNITKEGFIASWNVLHLNRSIPQSWTGPTPSSVKNTNWKMINHLLDLKISSEILHLA